MGHNVHTSLVEHVSLQPETQLFPLDDNSMADAERKAMEEQA
jgi:hypothetical protein